LFGSNMFGSMELSTDSSSEPAMRTPVPGLTRRRFLFAAASTGVVALAGTSGTVVAAESASTVAAADSLAGAGGARWVSRWLELFNTHTAEAISLAYRDARGFVAPALGKLNLILRDHRVNEAAPIDPALFDQLADLAEAAGVEPRYEIISGYRSPRTNAMLAGASHGVARRSLHTQGRAIDVRLKGVSCADLRDLALTAGRGGVGYYRRSDFVHLDTGRVRSWAG
jgi:uncharacterized protein YcbK (DUF882 family)